MIIREALDWQARLTAACVDKHFGGRTGIHASDLNACLRKQALRRLTEGYAETPERIMTYLRGRALHALLTTGAGEQPVEWEGITCSPDDILDDTLIEYKTTMYSSTKPVEEVMGDTWLRQAMSYALATGRDRVVFGVMHLLGDYKANRSPTIRCWEVQFEPDQLEEHAGWMRERRDVLKEALETGDLPGVEWRMGEWECKGCDFFGACQAELVGERRAA